MEELKEESLTKNDLSTCSVYSYRGLVQRCNGPAIVGDGVRPNIDCLYGKSVLIRQVLLSLGGIQYPSN